MDQGVLNYVLRNSGGRVAVPEDDFNGDILRLIERRYSVHFNAEAVWEKAPQNERTKSLWERAIEIAEDELGSIKFPFMIQGFYFVPDANEKNYGITIQKAPNFLIIQDDRFLAKYSRRRFDRVDNLGLPIFDKNGARTFVTRGKGLSNAYLNEEGTLLFNIEYSKIDYSYDDDRVALVRDSNAIS